MARQLSVASRPRRTQRERSETTTLELIDAARALFAEQGFSATKLEDITELAGMTKGALYHHFDGKSALFRAVFEREQERLVQVSVEAFSRRRDPWRGFTDGCLAFLEASMEPAVARITLFDAHAALGWDQMRRIEDAGSLAMMIVGIDMAIEAGRIRSQPAEPLARLLFGAVCEAAMATVRAPDPPTCLRDTTKALRRLLDGIALDPAAPARGRHPRPR